MKLTLDLLLTNWPGAFGLSCQHLLADPMCSFILGSCGNAGREKQHLDDCADSGLAVDGYLLTRAVDWYEWVRV